MYGFGITDKGKIRKKNEDSVLISNEPLGPLQNLYVISDGMGGHSAGEIASEKSITFFLEFITAKKAPEGAGLLDFLVDASKFANEKVLEYAARRESLRGMGATFTACVIENDKVYIAHVGDSRAYLVGGGEIFQLTVDHTYVNEMVKSGIISKEEAKNHPNKNIITRAIGVDSGLEIDCYAREIAKGDIVLLCSDGLSNMLDDSDIKNIVVSNPLDKIANVLVEAANACGGDDNISVIVIGEMQNELS
jgi:protein phosphatase